MTSSGNLHTESAQPSSSRSKQTRKQGVSCDACKFRKVKCDRREKIERNAGDPSDIACSVCMSYGTRCTFTQSAPRRRRGKRIVAIQQEQLDEDGDTLAARSLEEETLRMGSRSLPSLDIDLEGPLFGYDSAQQPHPRYKPVRPSTQADASTSKANALSRDGLFGVRGLTRALLDACIRSYFKYCHPCQPIIHTELFSARYKIFFDLFEEYKGVPPANASLPVGYDDRPLSHALIVAVACVGAALLEPPITEPGSLAKFRLQDRLALRFKAILEESDMITRLRDEGADIIEACYIMCDPCLKILGDDEVINNSIRPLDWAKVDESARKSMPFRNPLRLNASSAEAVVRLIFKLGINRAPKARTDCPPDDPRKFESATGLLQSEAECFRGMRIFWSAFLQDSFRSFGMRTTLQIGDDDYDLDLPRLISRPDGFFTALVFNESDSWKNRTRFGARNVHNRVGSDGIASASDLQPRRVDHFDAVQLEVMLRLAYIIRSVSIRFVSQRSQGRGVLHSDIDKAVSCLTAWSKQLPEELKFATQAEPLMRAKERGGLEATRDPSVAVAFRNSIKSLFLDALYRINVLSVWGAVADYGIRFEVDATEKISMLASQFGLGQDARGKEFSSDGIQKALEQAGKALAVDDATAELLKNTARAKLDKLLLSNFFPASTTARQAAELGLVRGSPTVLVNIFSHFSNFGINFAKRAAQMTVESAPFPVPDGVHPCDMILGHTENFITALDTIDSRESIPEMVKQLRTSLEESRYICNKIRGVHEAAREPHILTGLNAVDSMNRRSGSDGKDPRAGSNGGTPSSRTHSTSSLPTSTTTSISPGPIKGGDLNPWAAIESAPLNPFASLSRNQSLPSNAPSVLSHMEVDEVAMLARAAIPCHSEMHPESQPSEQSQPAIDKWPPLNVGHRIHDAEGNDVSSLYGPALDLDLEALTGVNTQWLDQHLGKQGYHLNPADASVFQMPTSVSVHGQNTSNANLNSVGELDGPEMPNTAYYNGIDTSPLPGEQLSDLESVLRQLNGSDGPDAVSSATWSNPVASLPSAVSGAGSSAATAPMSGGGTTDQQWQVFASQPTSDAQEWATSHWHGFSMYPSFAVADR